MSEAGAPPAEKLEAPVIAGVPIEDLGVLPDVVARINDLVEQPDTGSAEVAALIVRDPALTSKILRMINSSFFGLQREITSLGHAISYLGIHQVRNIVLSTALIQSFRFGHGVVEPRTIWEHSLGCAMAAKRVGDLVSSATGDEAYLGGLLHDIGRIALLAHLSDEYRAVVDVCERGLCTLREAETSHFGVSHEEAGFQIGTAWGFSQSVLAMIRYHHDPAAAGPDAPRAALIAFADAVCHERKLRFGFEIDDEIAAEEKEWAWQVIEAAYPSLPRERVEAIADEAVETTKGMVAELL